MAAAEAGSTLDRVRKGAFQIGQMKKVGLFPNKASPRSSGEVGDDDAGLPLSAKLSYALPTFTLLPMIVVVGSMTPVLYENGGVSPGALTFFLALTKGIDVVTDPAMSYITDSLRSDSGRRRPFMILGSLFYPLALFLLWSPPYLTSSSLAIYFGTTYQFFALMFTFVAIPYDALAPELTDDSDERESVFFFCSLFDLLGTIVGVTLPIYMKTSTNAKAPVDLGCDLWEHCEPYSTMHCFGFADVADCPLTGMGNACGSEFIARAKTYPVLTSCASSSPSDLCLASTATPVAKDGGTSWAERVVAPDGTKCADVSVDNGAADRNQCVLDFCDASNATDGTDGFCNCAADCGGQCALISERVSFRFYAGGLFAAVALVSLVNASFRLKERCQVNPQLALPAPTPMVPTISGTLSNKLFVSLLPPWIMDAISTAMLTQMCLYFTRYVVRPEMGTFTTPEGEEKPCEAAENVRATEAGSLLCDSTLVYTGCLGGALVGAVVLMPVWKWLSARVGRRNAWLLWSLVQATTTFMFVLIPMVPEGLLRVQSLIFFSVVNGGPLGARFLADAVLADIIDYDEFLTGARNEATYTMFKGFIPKMAAIPAAIVPMAIMNALGHVPVVDGFPQEQPAIMAPYLVLVTALIPAMLSLWSFVHKSGFGIRTDEQLEEIHAGILKHHSAMFEGKTAPKRRDPISGGEYAVTQIEVHEKEYVYAIQAFSPLFFDLNNAAKEQISLDDFAQLSMSKAKKVQGIGGTVLLVSVLGVWGTFGLLESTRDSWIPTLFVVAFGISITISCTGTLLRSTAAEIAEMIHDKNRKTALEEALTKVRGMQQERRDLPSNLKDVTENVQIGVEPRQIRKQHTLRRTFRNLCRPRVAARVAAIDQPEGERQELSVLSEGSAEGPPTGTTTSAQ